MAAWRKGEPGAFEELYGRYRQPLYGYFVNQCEGEASALELFQEIWLRVIAAVDGYRPQGRFRSWLFTLAHHRLVDHYRSRAGEAESAVQPDELAAPGHSPEEERGVEERVAVLRAALAALPVAQREAVLLREAVGLSIGEIAVVQEISHETAKSRLRYGYSKVRSLLGVRDDPS